MGGIIIGRKRGAGEGDVITLTKPDNEFFREDDGIYIFDVSINVCKTMSTRNKKW